MDRDKDIRLEVRNVRDSLTLRVRRLGDRDKVRG